jgi:type II secretory pathway component PulC
VRLDVFAAVSLGGWLAVGCATTTAPASSSPSSVAPSSVAPSSEAQDEHLIEASAPSDPAVAAVAEAPTPSAPPSGCAARVGADSLRRSALKRTVDAGLGRWLQTVSVDPLLARGHFRGWIIRSFNGGDSCFAGVDLRAGDVVTRVNGHGVEHPEEALDVWTKLPASSELVIDFLRDGQSRKVRFGIVDP